MNFEEWELLHDEGFLEINDDELEGGKKIYSSSDIQMNYFICPLKSVEEKGHHHHHPRVPPNHLLPVPIDLQTQHDHHVPPSENIKSFSTADQDPVSQVLFKKMKETEFIGMKVDPPKSSWSRGVKDCQFEGKKGDVIITCKEADIVDRSEMVMEKSEKMELDHEDGGGGVNIWKWSLTGIGGVICSLGVAAATFCIIRFNSQRKNKHPQHNQKLQFQIYTDDKRTKQVVHHASEAISAVRGVPITRAHITFGGSYDASL